MNRCRQMFSIVSVGFTSLEFVLYHIKTRRMETVMYTGEKNSS